MNHGPIVISENGFKAMNISADFAKYARKHGIRDPFEVSRQLFNKRVHKNSDGSWYVHTEWDAKSGKIKEDPDEPTHAEKDNWIAMRNEYVARRCFNEIGYESFLFHTEPCDYESAYDISHLREEDKFVPCLSADRQCMIRCHRYAECALQGTWKPE